ncbi:MAG: dCMP deaminase family protein [Desulfarculaceae bacterium]|nr:dCMP deaminase family protein [Desulfarculaceae bacterium]MCF8071860.1 dCMP deaminase family protein [Desulfarculaceae bacterium]MCF8101410.1 dCMP deaminase family protein [Desulfarculaceae bacterium]MCF8117401.1 dCMP deaminase family protein [Desulfarculaceae bacterium]
MDSRPSKDAYYLNLAREVSHRGTCLRRRYGAVIVKDDQIVSTGYAGAPRGVANCVDLGVCLRQEMDIPAGQRYELCRSVHAEMNAVIHASRAQTLGAVLYLAGVEVADGLPTAHPEPCLLCRRVIINAGIAEVVVQPRGAEIVHLDPQDWIDEENRAADEGLAAPKGLPMAGA